MARKKKLSPAEQAAREAEILKSPPDMSNETIKTLMSPEFEKMSNLDASQVALLLQEIVRGQNSLLANAQQTTVEIARIRERQDQADKEIAERLAEQKKFVEEVLDRAESLKRSGLENDKLIAKGAAQYQEAVVKARADKIAKDLLFKERLMKEPKVLVVSPGQLVTTMENGQQVARIIPEEVHIKGVHMRLPVGVPIELPQTIADYIAERRKSQQETAQRAALLSKNLESSKLAEEWNKIEGSRTDAMPQ
jgi:hypothetical protein